MNAPQTLSNRTLARLSFAVMTSALLIAITGFVASGYFFMGFLGDGRSGMGILQAFLLCFGIGAGVYLPALIVFFLARHVRSFGVKTPIGFAGVFISLPLWLFGGLSLIQRLPYWPYGLAALLLGLILLFWSMLVLRAFTPK